MTLMVDLFSSSCKPVILAYLSLSGDLGIKVKKKAKIRNPYNQITHLTQDTILESDKNQENIIYNKPRCQPFPRR